MKISWIIYLVSFVSGSKWQKQPPKKSPKNTLKPLFSKGLVISSVLTGKFIFLLYQKAGRVYTFIFIENINAG